MRTLRYTGLAMAVVACVTLITSPAAAMSGERVAASLSQGVGHRLVISAMGDPANEAATGFVRNTIGRTTLFYELVVTCLVVVGNRAAVGGEITASDVFPGHVGSGVIVFVEDAGEPGIATDKLSHSLNSDPQPAPGSDCPETQNPFFPIEAGNIQVLGG